MKRLNPIQRFAVLAFVGIIVLTLVAAYAGPEFKLKEVIILAIILAVGHDQFRALGGDGVRAFGKPDGSVVYDVKHVLPRNAVDGRL